VDTSTVIDATSMETDLFSHYALDVNERVRAKRTTSAVVSMDSPHSPAGLGFGSDCAGPALGPNGNGDQSAHS
jgi:hypothetical protein